MNPDMPQPSRPEIEARVTALLLGELPADEAALLRWAIANDAELAKLHDRLKTAIELTRETVAQPAETSPAATSAPLKLSDARREKLLAQFKTVRPKEFSSEGRRTRVTLLEVAVVVSIIAILASMILPALSSAKSRAKSTAIVNNLRQVELAKQTWASENNKSAGDKPTLDDLRPYIRDIPSVAGESYDLGRVGESPVAEIPADKAKEMGRLARGPVVNGRVALTLDDRVTLATKGVARENRGQYGSASSEAAVPEGVAEPLVTTGGMAPADSTPALPPPADFTIDSYAKETTKADTVYSQNAVGYVSTAPTTTVYLGPQTPTISEVTTISGRSATTTVENFVDFPAAQSAGRGEEHGFALAEPISSGNSKSAINLGGTTMQWSAGYDANLLSGPDAAGYNPNVNSAGAQFGGDRIDNVTFHAGTAFANKDANVILGAPTQNRQGEGYVSFKPQEETQHTGKVTDVFATNGSNMQFGWSDIMHLHQGNIGLADGSVQQVSTPKFRNSITNSIALDDVAGMRYLLETNSTVPVMGDVPYVGALTRATNRFTSRYASVDETQTAQLASAQSYYEAKDQLDRSKKFLNILEMKVLSTSTDTKLPLTAVVQQVEPAKPTTNAADWGILSGLRPMPESTARIKVMRTAPDTAGLETASNQGGYDPYFIQSEFEIIKSPAVLDRVIDSLHLTETWSKNGKTVDKATAEAMLRGRLSISPVRNTTLMDITMKGDSPQESADLANAIADAYSEQRKADYDALQNRGVAALKEEQAEQEKKIAAQAQEVERLRKLYHIDEPTNSNGEPPAAPRMPSTNAPIPQPEVQVRENRFSTFSLNVSDVSFKLAAASLEKAKLPDPASIRSEEFINAFDYRDPDPAAGTPVGFAWERAQYPFAHNRDLLRFSLKTAASGRIGGRALNLVLLIDNSGSMERADRVGIIREALRVLATQLQPQDKLSIVTFSRTAQLRADGVSGADATNALDRVSGLTPEGGTNLEEAMKLAYETALRHYLADGMNRVVLLTDGAANLGTVEPAVLKQKVESFRKQGIALDCFGIGWEDYNDDLLEQLSRNGDGRYGFINTPEDATANFAGQLAGALKIAASDVKVQVEFNPQRVISYRQIGYAKHQLTKEQFRDNTVDAAEIAAQEAGNALYTIETNPNGEGPIATVRIRYKTPGTTDYHEQEWPVPYNGTSVSLDQSSAAMRLAATASAFSEWLAVSPFAQEVSPDQLLHTLSGVPQTYGADPRPQKLEWMIRQAASLEGK